MFKKKVIAAFALLAFSTAVMADDGVLVILENGDTVGFEFKEKPALITGDDLVIKTDSEEVNYSYEDVKKVVFGEVPTKSDPTTSIQGINNSRSGNVSFRILDNGIEVFGLKNGERVSVYGVDGSQVAESASYADGSSVSVPLPQAAGKSVYIVRTSTGKSFKFIKK